MAEGDRVKRCRRHPTRPATVRTTFHYGDGTNLIEYLCAECQSTPPDLPGPQPLSLIRKPLSPVTTEPPNKAAGPMVTAVPSDQLNVAPSVRPVRGDTSPDDEPEAIRRFAETRGLSVERIPIGCGFALYYGEDEGAELLGTVFLNGENPTRWGKTPFFRDRTHGSAVECLRAQMERRTNV